MEEETTTTMVSSNVYGHPKFCKSRKPRISKFQKKRTQVDEEVGHDEFEDDDGDEKVGIERRIKALQKLVPGGETLEIDKLFEETAGYILALQGQGCAAREGGTRAAARYRGWSRQSGQPAAGQPTADRKAEDNTKKIKLQYHP